jgi:hypothetical protein
VIFLSLPLQVAGIPCHEPVSGSETFILDLIEHMHRF